MVSAILVVGKDKQIRLSKSEKDNFFKMISVAIDQAKYDMSSKFHSHLLFVFDIMYPYRNVK